MLKTVLREQSIAIAMTKDQDCASRNLDDDRGEIRIETEVSGDYISVQ